MVSNYKTELTGILAEVMFNIHYINRLNKRNCYQGLFTFFIQALT